MLVLIHFNVYWPDFNVTPCYGRLVTVATKETFFCWNALLTG